MSQAPLPADDDAAALEQSKRPIYSLIMAREAAVRALRDVLPSPADAAAVRATSAALVMPDILAISRSKLVQVLLLHIARTAETMSRS